MGWFDDLRDDEQATLTNLLDDPRASRIKEYAGDDLAFGCWLLRADAHCRTEVGVSIFDLADAPWRAWYDDELAPREAMVGAMEAG